ncbi:hypothetical protein, partial [Xanthomonas translucens]|uniref:hypothetical protein n=1 Tax=Xanthomonas campestris pv. translucens TaxID=343 RepID=UPI001C3FF6C5
MHLAQQLPQFVEDLLGQRVHAGFLLTVGDEKLDLAHAAHAAIRPPWFAARLRASPHCQRAWARRRATRRLQRFHARRPRRSVAPTRA